MPEGPEVQTVVDDLSTFIKNKEFISLEELKSSSVLDKEVLSLVGLRVKEVYRVAKAIVIRFDKDKNILIRLSFNGTFSFSGSKFDLFKVTFGENTFFYSDKRKLSRWRVLSDLDIANLDYSGVFDCLDASEEEIYSHLVSLCSRRIKKQIKPMLMDYKLLTGIGNIYASEVLFHAGISPFSIISELKDHQLKDLASAIDAILKKAYSVGGSSISDFVSPLGVEGKYQNYHKVYMKKKCPICGRDILKVKQNSRTTYYCSFCQG